MLPACASGVAARSASTGGALVERMKSAKSSTSTPSLSGSATLSNSATDRPFDVFSVGCSGLVIPISFKYASAENDNRLACWSFQPKRPARVAPGCSKTATLITCPRMDDGCCAAMLESVGLPIASTYPSPSTLCDDLNVNTFDLESI